MTRAYLYYTLRVTYRFHCYRRCCSCGASTYHTAHYMAPLFRQWPAQLSSNRKRFLRLLCEQPWANTTCKHNHSSYVDFYFLIIVLIHTVPAIPVIYITYSINNWSSYFVVTWQVYEIYEGVWYPLRIKGTTYSNDEFLQILNWFSSFSLRIWWKLVIINIINALARGKLMFF